MSTMELPQDLLSRTCLLRNSREILLFWGGASLGGQG